MLSNCRLFTCGTRGIMFHSPRSPAPFALTNVGKIAVFAFNPVNDACYFFFRWTVLRFFEDGSKCAYGLKSSLYVELLQCAFYPVRYPLNTGYQCKASRVRMVVCGPHLGWAAFAMNLSGFPLTCRLSWMWDVSSVLRASLEGMVFASRINVLTTDLLCCAGWCESNAKYLLVWMAFR